MRKLTLLRIFIAWLPVMLICFWGLAYLRAIALTVLGPGAPFSIDVATPGGKIRLKASSYSLSILRGFGTLFNVEIDDPKGRVLATAKNVEILFPSQNPAKGPFQVSVKDLYLVLRREKSGKLEIQSFIPTSTGPPSAIALSVTANHVTGEFIDETSKDTYTQPFSSPLIEFSKSASNWTANGDISLQQVGQLTLSLADFNGRWSGAVQSQKLNLSPKLMRYRSFLPAIAQENVSKISFSHLQIGGKGTFGFGKSAPFAFDSRVQFQSTNLQYNHLFAQSLDGFGRLTNHRFTGSVHASGPSTNVATSGSIDWQNSTRVSLTYRGSSSSLAAIAKEIQTPMPTGLVASGIRSTGTVNYSTVGGMSAGGNIIAANISDHYSGISPIVANKLVGTYTYQGDVISLKGDTSAQKFGAVSISGNYHLKSREIALHIRAPQVPLAAVEKFASLNSSKLGVLTGLMRVDAVVNGSISNPSAHFRAEGTGTYREPISKLKPPAPIAITGWALLGSFANKTIDVNRLWLKTSAGTAWASAKIDLNSKKLIASVESRGIDLSQVISGSQGLALAKGTVVGSLANPQFNGNVEVYDPQYNTFKATLIKGQLSASPHLLEISHLIALKGSSFVSGNLGMILPSEALSGSIQSKAISLYDFFGSNFGGTVAISATSIGGVLSHPSVQFSGQGTQLIVAKMPVDTASFVGTLKNNVVDLQNLKAHLAEGNVAIAGKYQVVQGIGSATANIDGLSLDRIVPIYAPEGQLDLDGITHGTATVQFNRNGLVNAESSGTVKAIVFNGAKEGRGIWSFNGKGHKFQGSIQISHKDKFIALENGTYDSTTGAYSGQALLNQVPAQNIYMASSPFINTLGSSAKEKLLSVRGVLQLVATIKGNTNDPKELSISVPEASASGIQYQGVKLGGLNLSGEYVHQETILNTFFYQDGEAVGSVSGNYNFNGNTAIEANFSNLNLLKMSELIPGLPKFSGKGSLSAMVSGESANPDVRASLDIENAKTGAIPSVFALSLDDIEAKNGKVSVAGNLRYNGFIGLVKGATLYDPQKGIIKDAPLDLNVLFAQRPLSDLAEYSPLINPKYAKGTFQGDANLTGSINDPHLDANVNVHAIQLGFEQPMIVSGSKKLIPFATQLLNSNFNLTLKNDVVQAQIQANSSDSGSMNGQISSRLVSLQKDLTSPDQFKLNQLLASALVGNLQFNKLAVNENTNLIATKAQLSGGLTFAGTLKSPLIKGSLVVDGLDTSLPTLASTASVASKPAIDPRFDITTTLNHTGTIRTALAAIKITGNADVKGSLSSPNIAANLAVAGGSIRLPGGRISLIPGGTVDGSYSVDSTGASTAHLNVDLMAETRVVATQMTGTLERYDVTLEVTGDLLSPDQVQFTASSDPPDLSQNQILAILGRTDILTALGSGSSFNQTQQALTGVLAGYAIPSLLSPFTRSLAKGLGLDYLNVEYNQYSQASLVIGKNFGGGLSFFASRQISQPLPGFPRYYDYRFMYRPKIFTGQLRRLSFIFGQDQYSPWKFGIQYSIRF